MIVAAAAGALVLPACGQDAEVDATNASVADVAEEVRKAGDSEAFIRPGQWQSVVTVADMVAPGLPPQASAQMRRMIGDGRRFETCLSKEQAQRPSEDFFAGRDNSCRYDHFRMGDGKIDARMRCAQDGVTQVMDMSGSYSPDSYRMDMTTSLEGAPEPAAGLKMTMRVDARRIGECAPVQAGQAAESR